MRLILAFLLIATTTCFGQRAPNGGLRSPAFVAQLQRPAAAGGGSPPGTPALELKADGQSFANNDPVGTWVAATGPNATAAGGVRPLFKTSIINGKSAMLFDNTDDLMTTTTLGGLSQPCSVFIVTKSVGSEATGRYVFTSNGGLGPSVFNFGAASQLGIFAGSAIDFAAGDNDANPHIWGVKFDGQNSTYRIDGGSEVGFELDLDVGSGTITETYIGNANDGSLPWDGYVAHIIVYSGAESMGPVFTYLNALYATY